MPHFVRGQIHLEMEVGGTAARMQNLHNRAGFGPGPVVSGHGGKMIPGYSRFPESARHIEQSSSNGHPRELTIDRSGARARIDPGAGCRVYQVGLVCLRKGRFTLAQLRLAP